jgi:dTDP-4-dehydrorhamnose reductase
MNILLFGKNGQLGSEFQKILPKLGKTAFLDYEDLDLCDLHVLEQAMNDLKPNLIVNASAYTAVDRAETEQDTAMRVNAQAPGAMADWARRSNAVLIHYSTDYVFDGRKGIPYTENDPANPLNVYGRSKLAGEENIRRAGGAYLILRTSWVYSARGAGFVSKVLEWARKNQTLKIVSDQVSNPTWARDLAEATFSVVSAHRDHLQEVMQERSGLYHLAGSGFASRYEWAKEILANDPKRTEQLVRSLEPVSSEEFPTPAARPLFSALDCSKFRETFGFSLPDWADSLRTAMTEAL